MLELESVAKAWHPRRGERRELLQGISLSVAPGETVAILGPSGSGKSTLLRLIAGLETPDAGRILFAGQDITGVPPERRQCALLFQDFALFPHLTVQDNVAFGLVEQGLARAQARAQARDMLGRFGLERFALGRVWQMSGGEQQRVALARALITRPRILLLDEPFSALDTALRMQLREEFRNHIAAFHMATVWVTHDAPEARAMAGRGMLLEQGTLQPQW